MGRLGGTEIAVVVIVLFLIYNLLKKNTNKNKTQDLSKIIDKEKSKEGLANIPDVCPHCKNPNTKKIRLCEWCGNQII